MIPSFSVRISVLLPTALRCLVRFEQGAMQIQNYKTDVAVEAVPNTASEQYEWYSCVT